VGCVGGDQWSAVEVDNRIGIVIMALDFDVLSN